MDDAARFRRSLEDELERLEASLAQASEAARTVMLDQSSVGRLSRMDALQQQAMAQRLHARLLTRRRAVQAALARIDGGAFGRCCRCDAPIGTDRLAQDAAAVFCMPCVAEREEGDDD